MNALLPYPTVRCSAPGGRCVASGLRRLGPGAATSFCIALLAGATWAQADTFTETFDDPLDVLEFSTIEPAGFEAFVSGSKAHLTKNEGTGNGFVEIVSEFTVTGDFEASAVVERVATGPDVAVGLQANHLVPGGLHNLGFSGAALRYSYFFVLPLEDSDFFADTSSVLTFRIRRTGTTIFHEVDTGSGFVTMESHDESRLGGPVELHLFLGEQAGGVAARSATFDTFTVTADEITFCGNGAVGSGETCDDDSLLWAPGEYCNADCAPLACGDPDDSGDVTAVDALFILRTSVGSRQCDACICNVDSSQGMATTVSDALLTLRKGVGQAVDLNCPPCT
jgi:hypothetical protein